MSENINLEDLQAYGNALQISVAAGEVMEAKLGTMKAASVAFVAKPKSTSPWAKYLRSSTLLLVTAYVLGLHPKAAAASSKSVDTFAKAITKVVKACVGQPIPVPEGEEDKGAVYASEDDVWYRAIDLLKDHKEWHEVPIAGIPQWLQLQLLDTERTERLLYADAKVLSAVKALQAAREALQAERKGKRFDAALAMLTVEVSTLVAMATPAPSTVDTILVSA